MALEKGSLDKASCLTLRGKLGFADSFLHGCLGALVLKRLSEHAYGRSSRLDADLIMALGAMRELLKHPEPRRVSCSLRKKWFVYTDASYEPESQTGGLGGVLIDGQAVLVAWYGFALDASVCKALGAEKKDTLIYELELFAAVLSLLLRCDGVSDEAKRVWFARVPTEANISDYPSRLAPASFLVDSLNCNPKALEIFNSILPKVSLVD